MSLRLSMYHRWRRFQVTSLLYPLLSAGLCLLSFPALAWVSLM